MSAFYLLGLFGVWAVLTALIWKGWRRIRREAAKPIGIDIAFAAVALAWLAASFWYGGGQKYYYDAEVERLCAIDGGIKVYETVKLPAERFEAYARTNWILPDSAEAKPNDDYFIVSDTRYYRTGNPEMSRRQYQIIRRIDSKVLGELVVYGRGGGDLPGPWMGSTYRCPQYGKNMEIETQVFQRGSK